MNETVEKILNTIGDIIELPNRFNILNKSIQDQMNVISANATHAEQTAAQALAAANEAKALPVGTAPTGLPRYHYELDAGNPDESWDRIIREGQAIQRKAYIEGERYWQAKQGDSPSGRGWYGSVSMPVITIVASEPEYNFRSTKRLPGRFRLWSPARWGSALRFHCDRGPTLHDSWTTATGIAYGFNTGAPIGIYVEPSVDVDEQFRTRPFEQSIENCLIVAHNGTLPIYLADNQDRFWIKSCNIQQHQGAMVGIKHGPPIQTDIIRQAPMANVYLADPRFMDLQMEGPHTMKRPQAGIFASGNNVHIRGLNSYGWLQAVYLHGGNNRYVQVQVHKSNTHNGRVPLKMDEVCGITLNQYKDHEYAHTIGAETLLLKPELTTSPKTLGTHQRGDGLFGG